jgi:hypothetical protein
MKIPCTILVGKCSKGSDHLGDDRRITLKRTVVKYGHKFVDYIQLALESVQMLAFTNTVMSILVS